MRMAYSHRVRRLVRSAALVGAGVVSSAAAHAQSSTIPWASAGADIYNTRATATDVGPDQLNASTVKQLRLKWTFASSGDVSATPTVEPGGLYFPDWGGMLYKLDPTTGEVLWSRRVSDYTGDPYSKSRSSPTIVGNAIIIGDLSLARVIAIDKMTGALLWMTRIDSNSDAFAGTSATVYNNIVYFGTASREESLAHPPNGYRGSVVALNATTGAILWRFTTVPDGYTGGAVVSAPVVDPRRHSLFIAANNNYSIPSNVEGCVVAAGADRDAQLACMDPSNYVDAILALDLETGALKWGRRFEGADTWTEACNTPSGCVQPPGTDFDFASSPNFSYVKDFVGVGDDRGGTSNYAMLGVGSKSGWYRALNPDNGGVFWATMVGAGGIQWGSAVDVSNHRQTYVAVKNDAHKTQVITDFYGRQTTVKAGSWAQLDSATGRINWQVPAYGQDLVRPKYGAAAPAPLSFNNNVVYAGATSGWMTALSSRTGWILWKFQSGGTVMSGPAIFNEWVFWGTGYGRLGGQSMNRLYAFAFQ